VTGDTVSLYVCSAGCNTAVSLSSQVIHLARVARRVNTGDRSRNAADYVCMYFMFMPCMQTLHRFRRVCGTAELDNDGLPLVENICLKCMYILMRFTITILDGYAGVVVFTVFTQLIPCFKLFFYRVMCFNCIFLP
jgi:hypothetical protein